MALGTTPGLQIARLALDTLLQDFPLLRQITSDFSAEQTLLGQEVKVQCPDALTAGDYNSTDGYVPQATNQTEYSLIINKHKHVTYGFDDTQRSSHDILLIERFARNAAHALGKAMVDDLTSVITIDNFINKTVLDSTTADRADFVDLSAKLSGRKLPKAGRYAVINSTGFASLSKDTVLVANAGSPAGTVRSGELGDVQGFHVSEYAQLPTNSEYLWGFAGTAEALMIATRVPTMPDMKALAGGSVEIVTEPTTGLSLQVRSWYDYRYGKEFRTYTIQYGVAAGDPARLERLVTQEPA